MSDFRPLQQYQLEALPAEELIGYHHTARRARDHRAARIALGILVWGFEDRVRYWVGKTVPIEHVEDVVSDVFESALKSSFDGNLPGQFGAWLREISRRRAADFHRARERRPSVQPLPEEHGGEDEVWGTSGTVPDPAEMVVERSVVEQALSELSSSHRRLIELAGPVDLGFDGIPAKQAAAKINIQLRGELSDPMTDVNAHQILSRFRRRCREIVAAGERSAAHG